MIIYLVRTENRLSISLQPFYFGKIISIELIKITNTYTFDKLKTYPYGTYTIDEDELSLLL